MLAATYAGIGFGNAGVHLPHACAYPIAGLVRDYRAPDYPDAEPLIPHGLAVVATAAAVFRFTYPTNPERHEEAARLLTDGRHGDGIDALPNAIVDALSRRRDPARPGRVRLWRGGRRPDRRGSAPPAATAGRQPAPGGRRGPCARSSADRWNPERPAQSGRASRAGGGERIEEIAAPTRRGHPGHTNRRRTDATASTSDRDGDRTCSSAPAAARPRPRGLGGRRRRRRATAAPSAAASPSAASGRIDPARRAPGRPLQLLAPGPVPDRQPVPVVQQRLQHPRRGRGGLEDGHRRPGRDVGGLAGRLGLHVPPRRQREVARRRAVHRRRRHVHDQLDRPELGRLQGLPARTGARSRAPTPSPARRTRPRASRRSTTRRSSSRWPPRTPGSSTASPTWPT